MASAKKIIEMKSLWLSLLAVLVFAWSAASAPLLGKRLPLLNDEVASTDAVLVPDLEADDGLGRVARAPWKAEKPAEEGKEPEEEERGERFLLKNSKLVLKSEGGEVRVVRGYYEKAMRQGVGALHIGFVTMEPHTLYLPQYMDANLLIFVRRGKQR